MRCPTSRPCALLLATLLAALLAAPAPATDLRAEGPALSERLARFQNFDQDGDGQVELAEVRTLHALPAARDATTRRAAVVLVEARLATDLAPELARLAHDLHTEGRPTLVLSIALAPSAAHQDGRYVLALRELLRAVDADPTFGPLAGATLVGHFPDAYLVRTINWRKRGAVTLRKGQADEASYSKRVWLRRVPEAVAHKADLVLADLDGRWEDVYVQPRTALPALVAVFEGDAPAHGGVALDVEESTRSFADFFYVRDGVAEVSAAGDASYVFLQDDAGNFECAPDDLELPNPMARPELAVARLDARGVAWSPRADLVDADGQGLLDAEGQPRALRFDAAAPSWKDDLFAPDARLELELLRAALDRNHAWRTGAADVTWRATSLAHDLGSGYGHAQTAGANWAPSDRARADVKGTPRLDEAVAWLAYPAALRSIHVHCDPFVNAFDKPNAARLDERLGGPAWTWTPGKNAAGDATLEPSVRAATKAGRLDWFLLQTLWRNGALGAAPAFYHHIGCEVISPAGARTLAFDHVDYGRRQIGEALLFFANGVALVGRAKVFYDTPRGFMDELSEGGTFGAAWQRYFDVEAAATRSSQVGGDIGRKRAYFWSVLGDWSLTLQPPARGTSDDLLAPGEVPGQLER